MCTCVLQILLQNGALRDFVLMHCGVCEMGFDAYLWSAMYSLVHDDIIKWKHFPCYWPFVRGIHRSLVISLYKDQCRWASMFFFICTWINRWVNNREAGDLRRHRAHFNDVIIVMEVSSAIFKSIIWSATKYSKCFDKETADKIILTSVINTAPAYG